MAKIDFEYSLRHSTRAKRVSLTVYPDGRVLVTVPPRASDRTVTRFVGEYAPWVRKQLAKTETSRDCIFLPAGRRDYLRNKERCRVFVKTAIARHNRHYGLTFNRIAIKNLYSSWGSCSAKRNLNFNYKLIHLPAQLGEYIVVHELCHLREMNHSRRFWDLVAQTVPDHKQRRRELRKYLM
jgi:hypothetical protein